MSDDRHGRDQNHDQVHERWRVRALRAEAELEALKQREARLRAELQLLRRASRSAGPRSGA